MNNVFFQDTGKMLYHRSDGNWHDLPESADGRLPHRGRKVGQKLHVAVLLLRRSSLLASRPVFGNRPGRARTSRRIRCDRTECIQRHVQHASALGAHDDCARADHRACGGDCVPVQRQVSQGGGRYPEDGPEGAKASKLRLPKYAAGIFGESARRKWCPSELQKCRDD